MRGKLAVGGLILGAAWGAYRRLHRPSSLEGSYVDAPTKVLIIGGGFGGLAVARGLARDLSGTADVGVALVDHLNYTTFWPMVPSIIPSNAEVRHVAHSLRRILKPLGIEYFQGQVAAVNFEARRVKTNQRDYPYDYLVLAPGSRTTFFGTPGAEENALDVKGLRDARPDLRCARRRLSQCRLRRCARRAGKCRRSDSQRPRRSACTRRHAQARLPANRGHQRRKGRRGQVRFGGDLRRTHHTEPHHHLGRRDRTPTPGR